MKKAGRIAAVFCLLVAAVFAERAEAQSVKVGSWKAADFGSTYSEFSWDFSKYIPSIIKKPGVYSIVFAYEAGPHKLTMANAVVIADGKQIYSDPGKRSIGPFPVSMEYSFTLDYVPKKLLFKANARTSGANDTYGKIEISVAKELYPGQFEKPAATASAAKSSGSAAAKKANAVQAGSWKKDDFSKKKEKRSWDFSKCVQSVITKPGLYEIVFTYTGGPHKLCLSQAAVKVDGKVAAAANEERSCGMNPHSIVYSFEVKSVPKTLALEALAWTSGGADSAGKIELRECLLARGTLAIPDGVKKIEGGKYRDNDVVSEIRFVNSVAEIGGYAFNNNSALKKLVVPGSVRIIGGNAFSGCVNLEEVVLEEGVEEIHKNAFSDCPRLKFVTLPKSIKKIEGEGIFTQGRDKRIFRSWLGSAACNAALQNECTIDILGIDAQNAANINLKYLSVSVNKTIADGAFKNLPIELVDLNNSISSIGKNAFHPKTTLRVKRGTYGDKWAKANGYFLCEALADLNFYTRDKAKKIDEDFERVMTDGEPYVDWASYIIKIQEPLSIESRRGEISLVSYMLRPCANVTVTMNGKTVLEKKTIQPLSRYVLCKAEQKLSPKDFKVSSDDSLYKKMRALASVIDWKIAFDDKYIRKTAERYHPGVSYIPMRPVFCREWLAALCNHAYVIASSDYERENYAGVKEKKFFSDKAGTKFLTTEDMDALLKKARKRALKVGRTDGGSFEEGTPVYGLGGKETYSIWSEDGWVNYNDIFLTDEMYFNCAKKDAAFYHEFSHTVGWDHDSGNMCPRGSNSSGWPGVGFALFKKMYEAGELPYSDPNLFNSALFSSDEIRAPDPADYFVKDGTLYLPDGIPFVDIDSDSGRFTKTVIPPSASLIKKMGFASTDIQDITIPGTVKVIGEDAFWNCQNLRNVIIEEGVEEIGADAFTTSSVRRIEIPQSVFKIGAMEAFNPQTVWVVKKGSAAHDFVVKNGLKNVIVK